MQTPVLSIVIPTRNRHNTLRVIVDYILAWGSYDFELVIHDNGDDRGVLADMVEKYRDDPRLRYFYSSDTMDLIANSSAAISKATGEYLCFIGDDDGLIPATVKLCHWLKANDYDSATFERGFYIWPDLADVVSKETRNTGPLRVSQFKKSVVKIDSMKELKRFLRAGVTNIHYCGPSPYNGIVRRAIFEQTLARTGSYFPAPTPDVSCMVSASILGTTHAHIGIPFVCGGQSNASAAGLGRRGMHVGELRDIKSLPANTADAWTEQLPFFWSGFTINAESVLKTLHAFGRADLADLFNFNRNIAACMVYLNPDYRSRAKQHVRDLPRSKRGNITMAGVLAQIPVIYMKRALGWIRRHQAKTTFSQHSDIAAALTYIQNAVAADFDQLDVTRDIPLDFAQIKFHFRE